MSKQIPVQEGLFTLPSKPNELPHLIGSKCQNCGFINFPAIDSCVKCGSDNVEKVSLSRKGKVYSSTIHRHKKAPHYYNGPIPFELGFVQLPEGTMIPSRFLGTKMDAPIPIDTEVELIIEKLETDQDGNDIMFYAFKPIVK